MATKTGVINIGFQGGGTNKPPVEISKSASGRISWEEDVPTGETDFEIACPSLDISACKQIFIMSTQNVTFETNSGTPGEGVDSLTLIANEPYPWWLGAPFVNKITTDITTGVFITNASGATATISFEAIVDTTPE